jgi:hypothetical protein
MRAALSTLYLNEFSQFTKDFFRSDGLYSVRRSEIESTDPDGGPAFGLS